MAKTNLKAVSVYMPDDVADKLTRASGLDRRSLSNFLLNAGIEKAEALGIKVFSKERFQRVASGR